MGSIITPIIQCIVSTLDMIYHKNNPNQTLESDKMLKKMKKIDFIEMKNEEEMEKINEKIDKLEDKIGSIPVFSPIKSPRKKYK